MGREGSAPCGQLLRVLGQQVSAPFTCGFQDYFEHQHPADIPGKKDEGCSWKFLYQAWEWCTSLLCPHFTGWKSVTWPYLTAGEAVRSILLVCQDEYSVVVCWEAFDFTSQTTHPLPLKERAPFPSRALNWPRPRILWCPVPSSGLGLWLFMVWQAELEMSICSYLMYVLARGQKNCNRNYISELNYNIIW